MMNEQEKIARLIVLHLQGQTSEEEERELEVWRSASSAHEEIFVRCCSEKHWEKSLHRFVRTDREHKHLRKSLEARVVGHGHRIRMRKWGYVAAIVVLLIGFWGVLIYNHDIGKSIQVSDNKNERYNDKSVVLALEDGSFVDLGDSANREMLELQKGLEVGKERLSYKKAVEDSGKTVAHTLMVPRGGEYVVTLSDSTKVYLNADTRLTYPVRFSGKERKVVLEGEAYFDVAKNREMPFVVAVGDMRVEVTGTTFGIRAYKEEREVLTTLETGKVNVKEGNQMVSLLPDEQAVFNVQKKSMEKRRVDVNQYLAWKSGYMVFDNTPLERIMSDLDRWYDVHTVFKRPEMRGYRFSLNIKKHVSYMETLKLLEAAGDIHFEVEGDTIHVN